MPKPQDTVEIRIFVDKNRRNELKSKAAAKGMTITEYFLYLDESQKELLVSS